MNFSEPFFLNTILLISTILILAIPCCTCTSLNTITPDQPLKDGDVLVSTRNTFALGFFSPSNSNNRYIGIWYNKVPQQTVVWVANRDNPLINDTSGVLTVNGQGGLILHGRNRNSPLWSTNVSVHNTNTSMAKLLNVGNLVLLDQNNTAQNLIWQSFDHPTDTMLPFMKLGLNRVSGLNWVLTSWKSKDDPGTGNNTCLIDPNGYPQLFLKSGRVPKWRGGPWTGLRWSGVPEMARPKFILNASFVNDPDQVIITYGILNDSIFSRMMIDESGTLHRSTWQDGARQWVEFWSAPSEWCDNYGRCGPNGYCDPSDASKFECTCLPGFQPGSPRNWELRDASGGCVRKGDAHVCGNGEGFVKIAHAKLPDTSVARVEMGLSLRACEQVCLKDCNCTAYTSANESRDGDGCLTWHGDLVDMRTYSGAGQDLYVRVDAITLAEYTKESNSSISKIGKLVIALGSVAVLFLLCFAVYWRAKRTRKVKEHQSKYLLSIPASPRTSFDGFPSKDELDESRTSDIPFFDLNTVAAATNNFSIANKLGEGGFGSVYKGMSKEGKEIAVKRLSKHSGQGTEEFKNEVLLIAKLQHRNLVRILGCCVHGEERILIYEYLPNKSLDSFIFNEGNRKLLDWRKRFDIICGIARGMLYLHQDSRLRIIHRDLKASNVLLDAHLNPKIADFGMARIFGGDQIEANTNRVVGTYGYMSPEYAMEGRFSEKSDVYSFGVLILEIITGKKNTGHYYDWNPNLNLIGHVWEVWKEGRATEMVESSLDESFGGEALRCITIGLLCVQEYANDRPTMSAVVFMLGNEATPPTPKQPAFLFKKSYTSSGDPSTSEGVNSVNDVTCTMVEAR